MSKLSENQREVLAYIDAILTMIEKYPTLKGDASNGDLNIGVSTNPFSFLLSIISKQVSDSEMIDWLVNLLTSSLPAIELGVKGILLSNLKQTIDCNNDPKIPAWLRQNVSYSSLSSNIVGQPSRNNDRGFIFNIKNIDFNNLLSYSPLSEQGQMKYFGTKSYYKINLSELSDIKYYSYTDAVNALTEYNNSNSNSSSTSSLQDLIKVSEIDNVFELARAQDFNAFLWFIINKAYFTQSTQIDGDLSDYTKYYEINGEELTSQPFKDLSPETTVLEQFSGTTRTSGARPLDFSPGDTIIQNINGKYYNVISLCIKNVSNKVELEPITDNSGLDYGKVNVLDDVVVSHSSPSDNVFTFVPVSSNYRSANWYVNSGTFFNFLLPQNKRLSRDYTKDFALCNIELLTPQMLMNATVNGLPYEYTSYETYIRLTILPAPLIHFPYTSIEVKVNENNAPISIETEGESILKIKRILFNASGKPDKNGKYTVIPQYNADGSIKRIDDKISKTTRYDLEGNRGYVVVNWEDGSYALKTDGDVVDKSALIECYPGLTVYDFNYNFVMGMQLFDSAVVASQLIEMASNISMQGSLGLNLSINKKETLYQARVAEIVKNIINSTEYEASDCFYTFSNKKFEELLNEAELKRAQGYPFANSESHAAVVSLDDAYSILSEFRDDATLEENKEVITRAFTEASALITNEVLPQDKYNVNLEFIQALIQDLVLIIVNSLLTPKIVLLFELNKQLMGGHDENLSIEDFIESISGLITSVVIEIRDLILSELLNWALSILSDLCSKLSTMLILEQTEFYTRLIKSLLKACSFKSSKQSNLPNELDYVDYADIDTPQDQPINNEC